MSIEEIFDELHVEYRHAGEHQHARENWVQIKNCPFCGSDNYHLGWNLENNYASCWKCGWHYGPKTLEALGATKTQLRDLSATLTPLRDGKHATGQPHANALQRPTGLGPLLLSHKKYLRGRGFNSSEIEERWRIQGIGFEPKLAWRIYIPIFYHNVEVSWTTRAIGDRVAQRYVSASATQETMSHKELIYGLDYCRYSIVIVEGPLDAWKIGPGAGALFGTAFTTAQVKLLISFPKRFICLDSSPDAQKVAVNLAEQLSAFPGTTENIVLDSKDPGEATDKELRTIRRIAKLIQ